MNAPFTFRESLQCTEPHPYVQVLINRSAVCSQVKEGWVARDGTFLWSVSLLGPFYGSGSFPERMVRQCSGVDGTCACAGELLDPKNAANFDAVDDGGFCHARVVAPRDGLNIETLRQEERDEELYSQERFLESRLMSGPV